MLRLNTLPCRYVLQCIMHNFTNLQTREQNISLELNVGSQRARLHIIDFSEIGLAKANVAMTSNI